MRQLAQLDVGDRRLRFPGKWIAEGPWRRFGLYNNYVVIRGDASVMCVPAHAGELVPGSTEDLVAVLNGFQDAANPPRAPMTIELDPTYRCASVDCGGHCFSASYRALSPNASIPAEVIRLVLESFAGAGGRIVRFDGGGDPLLHESVRNGDLPVLADRLGLKTTILTSGDLLARTALERLGAARCYLRVSINAASDRRRRDFHGNNVALSGILRRLERFAAFLDASGSDLPIGATFLLDHTNYVELTDCARRCRDAGIAHFSVRRVLGPEPLRPSMSAAQEAAIRQAFDELATLRTDRFRVFYPWRRIGEADQNPAAGDFESRRCWQSTLKVVIEPALDSPGMRAQLCGRYRGGGIGQRMQLPELFSTGEGSDWVSRWRESFSTYRYGRDELPRHCVSCIDRGFIQLVDRLVDFLGLPPRPFEVLHLWSDQRPEVAYWMSS